MKIFWKINALFLLITLFYSCKPDHNTIRLNEEYEKIMEIHDDVMPKLSNIHNLKKKINADFSENKEAQKIVNELDAADEMMMAWMHTFDKPDYKNIELAHKYYETELSRVQIVRDSILHSIEKAQIFLHNHE